ncbi:MAG: hypothetical protein BWY61_01371 [Firmicutes bacterium ADurb.Bin354]|nr:MAG: hypothetical protein BWY61_01371 [Firmicutes bacterium ADurb.Bin354]
MYNKYHVRLLTDILQPLYQSLFIGMTAHSGKCLYLRTDFDIFSEKLDLFLTINKYASQCSFSLIADKKDGAFRSPEIMFEMMPDSARITHSGSRYDNLGLGIKVDHLGFVTGYAQMQIGKCDGINPLINKCSGFIRKTAVYIFTEDFRCFNSKRTVHKYGKIRYVAYEPLCLDLSDIIEHLLSTSDCKGRDNHISAAS